jgi:hypothetical protein
MGLVDVDEKCEVEGKYDIEILTSVFSMKTKIFGLHQKMLATLYDVDVRTIFYLPLFGAFYLKIRL